MAGAHTTAHAGTTQLTRTTNHARTATWKLRNSQRHGKACRTRRWRITPVLASLRDSPQPGVGTQLLRRVLGAVHDDGSVLVLQALLQVMPRHTGNGVAQMTDNCTPFRSYVRRCLADDACDLVLSSGFLAFAYHSGFLQAVQDAGIKVGSSEVAATPPNGGHAAGCVHTDSADSLRKSQDTVAMAQSQLCGARCGA